MLSQAIILGLQACETHRLWLDSCWQRQPRHLLRHALPSVIIPNTKYPITLRFKACVTTSTTSTTFLLQGLLGKKNRIGGSSVRHRRTLLNKKKRKRGAETS